MTPRSLWMLLIHTSFHDYGRILVGLAGLTVGLAIWLAFLLVLLVLAAIALVYGLRHPDVVVGVLLFGAFLVLLCPPKRGTSVDAFLAQVRSRAPGPPPSDPPQDA